MTMDPGLAAQLAGFREARAELEAARISEEGGADVPATWAHPG